MNVIEARRSRQLIVRVDRGEEIPTALLRALDEIEARSGWVEGTGSLEAAEIAVVDQSARSHATARLIEGPCDVVTLNGSIAQQAGQSSLRLWVTLARETELGLQLAAGELIWARAYALELRVTAFDDVVLARVPDERTGLALLAAQNGGALSDPAQRMAPPPEPTFAPSPSPAASPAASPSPAATTSPAMPQRITRHEQAEETYPEIGDLVTHFHFGECEVIGSDGERIRLRQERDGRVREVALTMLKIEAPTIDPATSKRHFRLARKH